MEIKQITSIIEAGSFARIFHTNGVTDGRIERINYDKKDPKKNFVMVKKKASATHVYFDDILEIELLSDEEIEKLGYSLTGSLFVFPQWANKFLRKRKVRFFDDDKRPYVRPSRDVDPEIYNKPETKDFYDLAKQIKFLQWNNTKLSESDPRTKKLLTTLEENVNQTDDYERQRDAKILSAIAYGLLGDYEKVYEYYLDLFEINSAFALAFQNGWYDKAKELVTSQKCFLSYNCFPYLIGLGVTAMAEKNDPSVLLDLQIVPPLTLKAQFRLKMWNAALQAYLVLVKGSYDPACDDMDDEAKFAALKKECSEFDPIEKILVSEEQPKTVRFYEKTNAISKKRKVLRENRPSKDGPCKLAHYIWVTEGLPYEAIPYYKKAIEILDSPASASADLVSIYVQLHRYREAAEVLRGVGQKYMVPEKFINIVGTVCEHHPEMRKLLGETDVESEEKENYYQQALNAFSAKHDYQAAISLYKKAIEAGQNASSSVQSLIQIYIYLDQTDEGFALLSSPEGSVLDESARLQAERSLLLKEKDQRRLGKIKEVYNKLLEAPKNEENRVFIYQQEVSLLIKIGAYQDAIEALKGELSAIRLLKDKAKASGYLVKCYGLLNSCFKKIGDEEKAKEYQKMALEINPNAAFINKESENGDEESDLSLDDDFIEGQISDYFLNKISRVKLEKNDIQEGNPTRKEIRSWYSDSTDKALSNNERANIAFRAADLSKSEPLNYEFYAQNGIDFFARYRLQEERNFPVARYSIQCLVRFRGKEAERRIDRLIGVFFASMLYGSSECLALAKKEKPLPSILKGAGEKTPNFPLLISETFLLLKNLDNEKAKTRVLTALQKWGYAERVHHEFVKLAGGDEREISKEEFVSSYDLACRKFLKLRQEYLGIVRRCLDDFVEKKSMQEDLNSFYKNGYKYYCFELDEETHLDIKEGLEHLNRYGSSTNFADRRVALEKTNELFRKIADRVYENPTDYGLSILKIIEPFLNNGFEKEVKDFFSSTKPELEVKAVNSSIDQEKSILRITLRFLNKEEKQNAENVSYEVSSDQATLLKKEDCDNVLYGNGKPYETNVAFQLNEELLRSGTISMDIKIHGKYNTSLKDFREGVLFKGPCVSALGGEESFKEIENPFAKYSNGGAVDDDSMFFGREDVERELLRWVSSSDPLSKKGQAKALVGQKRCGKSTVLYHLAKRLQEDPENIVVDLKSLAKFGEEGNIITGFCKQTLKKLKGEMKKNAELWGLMEEAKIFEIDKEEAPAINMNLVLEEAIELLHEENHKGHHYRIIFLIDEFSSLYPLVRQNGDASANRFPAFFKAFIESNGVYVVFAAHDHFEKLQKIYTNELASIGVLPLSYLKKEDAMALMSDPIPLLDENGQPKLDGAGNKISRYGEGVREYLFDLTAGSAYLIMIFCDGLVDYINETKFNKISVSQIEDCEERLFQNKKIDEGHFDPLYGDEGDPDPKHSLWEKNKTILARIAKASHRYGGWAMVSDIIEKEEDSVLLDVLIRRDVVELKDGANQCRIKVGLYNDWLLRRKIS